MRRAPGRSSRIAGQVPISQTGARANGTAPCPFPAKRGEGRGRGRSTCSNARRFPSPGSRPAAGEVTLRRSRFPRLIAASSRNAQRHRLGDPDAVDAGGEDAAGIAGAFARRIEAARVAGFGSRRRRARSGSATRCASRRRSSSRRACAKPLICRSKPGSASRIAAMAKSGRHGARSAGVHAGPV